MLKLNQYGVPALVLLCSLVSGCATPPPPPAESAAMTLQEMEQVGAEAEREIAAGQRTKAAELYIRIVKAYPDNAQAWFRLGTLYLRLGHNDAAQQVFEHVLKLDPTLTKANANLALSHLHQFRAAAGLAVQSAQVPSENRAALQSLMRDVDHALTVPAAATQGQPK